MNKWETKKRMTESVKLLKVSELFSALSQLSIFSKHVFE